EVPVDADCEGLANCLDEFARRYVAVSDDVVMNERRGGVPNFLRAEDPNLPVPVFERGRISESGAAPRWAELALVNAPVQPSRPATERRESGNEVWRHGTAIEVRVPPEPADVE